MTGTGVTRRELLVAAGAAAIGVTGTGLVESPPWGTAKRADARPAQVASGSLAFYGDHQPGIATTPPAALLLGAFDVVVTGQAALRDLLRRWSDAARVLMDGALLSASDLGVVPGDGAAGPADSGETRGLTAENLTVTFGLGPGVFDGRFGVAARKPAGFGALPAMPGDELDLARSGGDLLIQVCADDAVVAFHAMRQLTRLAADVAEPRWTQRGFGATATFRGTQTPRNLFGQKDGTGNPQPGTLGFDPVVWVQPDDSPNWLAGGSYLAVRRIRMDLLSWDRTPVARQARVLGRDPATGAPLSSYTRRTYFTARAGRSAQLRAPRVEQFPPSLTSSMGLRRACSVASAGR